MIELDLTEAVEAAAPALYGVVMEHSTYADAGAEDRETVRTVAHVVIAKASSNIAKQVAEQIAAAIAAEEDSRRALADVTGDARMEYQADTLSVAVEIAREAVR